MEESDGGSRLGTGVLGVKTNIGYPSVEPRYQAFQSLFTKKGPELDPKILEMRSRKDW